MGFDKVDASTVYQKQKSRQSREIFSSTLMGQFLMLALIEVRGCSGAVSDERSSCSST